MNQAEELIRLEDLAAEYQRIIGNRCVIHLNAAVDIEEEREQGYIVATRQPYKIPKIKSESLQIAIRFYVACEVREDYNDAINALTNLIGYRSGRITSKDRLFKYFSFLDFAAPLNEPVIDEGQFKQVLEMRGTCLVTQTDGGAIVGNDAEFYFGYTENGVECWGEIAVLSKVTNLGKATEAPQLSDSITAKAINSTQFYTHSITFLILRNSICERLFKALDGIKPFGLNEEVKLFSKYSEFTKPRVNVELSFGDDNDLSVPRWSNYGPSDGITTFMRLNGKWCNEKPPFMSYDTDEYLTHCGITLRREVGAVVANGFTFKIKTVTSEGAIDTDKTKVISVTNDIADLKAGVITSGQIEMNAGAFVVANITLQEKLVVSDAVAEESYNGENDTVMLAYTTPT